MGRDGEGWVISEAWGSTPTPHLLLGPLCHLARLGNALLPSPHILTSVDAIASVSRLARSAAWRDWAMLFSSCLLSPDKGVRCDEGIERHVGGGVTDE